MPLYVALGIDEDESSQDRRGPLEASGHAGVIQDRVRVNVGNHFGGRSPYGTSAESKVLFFSHQLKGNFKEARRLSESRLPEHIGWTGGSRLGRELYNTH